jgi:asparagine synthase (glutamine-hydrolysing)
MCGIAGAIGVLDVELVRAVQLASERQRHRGPDDDGEWRSGALGQPGAAFGFRRLAILDLSPDGHQPMVDPATGNAIAFNGEIYNFRELRAELEAGGARFRSRTDTEVILHAYARWGDGAVSRLRGMFGFAIWDARERRVLLARDRLGIKPLFTCVVRRAGAPDVVLFASELRALLATGLVPRRLHRGALSTYLWNGFVVGPDALVDGVQLLPPGTTARVEPGSARVEPMRYWQLPAEPPAGGGDGRRAVDALRAELQTAMRQHLVSDVPLGVFLSGGVDSSAVAAMAARHGGDGAVRTFNVSFDEAAFDESKYARAVAAQLRTQHTDVRLTQRDFVEHLDEAVRAIDQPTFDGINTFFVSRAVRHAGITVALAGTGGDELFGGYRSFRDVPASARAAGALRWLPRPLLRAFARGVARWKTGRAGEVPPQTRWGKLGDALCSGGAMVDAYQTAYAMFTRDVHAALLGGEVAGVRSGLPAERAAELDALVRGRSPLHAVSTLELASFLGERLLRDTDWSGMAVSLEVRVPLLDHAVVEAAAAVPAARRFRPLGRKALLRELALDGVDPSIFDRPKSGFVLPIEAWCRQQLRSDVEQVLTSRDACAAAGVDASTVGRLWRAFDRGAPGMYWSRVWELYVLLRWCREHRVAA